MGISLCRMTEGGDDFDQENYIVIDRWTLDYLESITHDAVFNEWVARLELYETVTFGSDEYAPLISSLRSIKNNLEHIAKDAPPPDYVDYEIIEDPRNGREFGFDGAKSFFDSLDSLLSLYLKDESELIASGD